MPFLVAGFSSSYSPSYAIAWAGTSQYSWVTDRERATVFPSFLDAQVAYAAMACGQHGMHPELVSIVNDCYVVQRADWVELASPGRPVNPAISLLQAQIAAIEDSLTKRHMDIFQGGTQYTVLHATKKRLQTVLDTISQQA
jgi:hypothetical protein